jgi:DNA-binding IclR family transcriptional regulator
MASEPTGTQAIDRAAQLLVSIVESTHPPSVGELATRAALPKSTTSRLLAALERQGLVQRLGERGRLHPGPVLLRFATGDSSSALLELAAPSLRRLADASGETVNLAVPGQLGVEHLAQEDTAHIVGVANWVGRRVPLHVAANGKVFLAHGTQRAPQLQLERLTPLSIVDPTKLELELARVRARGYATSVDELEHGLSAVAAPIFGQSVSGQGGGDAFAALSISGPTARLTSERIATLAPLLIDEANRLAQRLGHRDHARGAA